MRFYLVAGVKCVHTAHALRVARITHTGLTGRWYATHRWHNVSPASIARLLMQPQAQIWFTDRWSHDRLFQIINAKGDGVER